MKVPLTALAEEHGFSGVVLVTRGKEVLGDALPLIDDRVTVEHLLTHTSGIGDYCDEEADPPPPPTPFLATSAGYLAALDGYPQVAPPGTEFRCNNGAFAVLGLIAERIAGIPFADLVRIRVTEPAGLADTAFLRSDALPARTATGYLEDSRTNVFSLPVAGFADGGIYSSAPDFRRFWPALLGGRILPREWVDRMLRPHAERYGLGFWLPRPGVVHPERRRPRRHVLEHTRAGVRARRDPDLEQPPRWRPPAGVAGRVLHEGLTPSGTKATFGEFNGLAAYLSRGA
ncbi:serine hydrolase domain-containing protein [Amycolatopsis sp. NPDC026612]|uniref:serine hydrolase domain-containing protein n=1 Tax=Amycolatopsis sp. NPDC026612 TaxID=3155466 RepID=UPI0034072FBA